MLKRNIGILLFSILVAMLEVIGNAQMPVLPFLGVALLMSVILYITEQSGLLLEKFRKSVWSYFVAVVLLFNSSLFVLTDAKDRYVLLWIQLAWLIPAVISYFIKKTCDENLVFSQEIFQWYLLFALFIVGERVMNGLDIFNNVDVDIFHLLFAIVVWKCLSIPLFFYQKRGKKVDSIN